MDQKWISIIYFLSVVSVSAYVPHRYHFVNQSKNWTEAQNYCRQTYTDLATINNMDEMKKLNETLKDVVKSSAWIGLKRGDTGRWQWSLGGFYSVKDSNWNKGEPNNDGRNEFCVAMKKYWGKWLDESCGRQFPFVCFDDKKKNTEPYILVEEKKSWHDAQRHCRLHHRDLTSVRNKSERKQIEHAVKILHFSRLWIGLFNESWEWSDKSNASFRYWESSQPDNQENNENCATVHTVDQGYWHDENCKKTHPFICHEGEFYSI
ncbi:C-type lectin BiL-like [Astyanax mexicanus]|uniref:C-type lectin BiL-like n=1 Tax=Astyanax mexicanus TaxID=7994 RepID=UPI0020CB5276|nr:C-type lectin BiL-like [Astyanax mexicanus]